MFIRKLTTLALFAILLLTAGCSTENPLCTDNFCVEGQIYPKDWLHGDEDYSELAIDDTALLNAITGTTPPPPRLSPAPTLSEIVAHVAAGGRDCLEQTYTLEGTVRIKFVDEFSNFITLRTGHENVSFFISGGDNLDALVRYDEGQTYTFTIVVREVGRYREDDRKYQSIHTDLVRRPTR